jgi:hypothetical protein
VSLAVRGRRSGASALQRAEDFLLAPGADARPVLSREEPSEGLAAFVRRSILDAYTTADRLAESARMGGGSDRNFGSPLAGHLQLVVRLLRSGFGARVFYTVHGGYDTHARQLPHHSRLLADLSFSLQAFLADLKAAMPSEFFQPWRLGLFSPLTHSVGFSAAGATVVVIVRHALVYRVVVPARVWGVPFPSQRNTGKSRTTTSRTWICPGVHRPHRRLGRASS